MWILRIDMKELSYKLEEVPERYRLLYGRALTSQMIFDEVPPLCHALGPNNKLVFSAGIVTSTSAPTSARVSVGCKSPLTGGIKEANAGTSWAPDLASMRIRALVIEGFPEQGEKYWGTFISWDKDAGKPKVEFFEASQYTDQDLPRTLQDHTEITDPKRHAHTEHHNPQHPGNFRRNPGQRLRPNNRHDRYQQNQHSHVAHKEPAEFLHK